MQQALNIFTSKELTLRPYQEEIVSMIHQETTNRLCVQLPTGGGKTVIASKLISEILEQKKKVFFIVSRSTLVMQTYRYFEWTSSIIKAGFENYFDEKKNLQIVMLQTWYARRHKLNIIPDVIIYDEAHIGVSGGAMFTELVNRFPHIRFIGLTATPITDKGKKLPFFEKTISKYQTKDLIDSGFLSPYRMFALPIDIDLKGIRTVSGDFDEGQLSKEMRQTRVVLHIMTAIEKYISTQKTMVFCVDIEHAQSTFNELLSMGKKACIMHSMRSGADNEKALEDFKNGNAQFIVNVSMLTIGFDMPDVEALVIARPTKVLRLYLQIVGRGLRIHPNKKECLILDCGLLYQKHGLPNEFRNWNIPEQPSKKDSEAFKKIHCCLRCDIGLINLICPNCEREHFCCRHCHEVFFKTKDETGKSICIECLIRLAQEEEERAAEAARRQALEEQKEFELIEVTEKYKNTVNNGGTYFQDYSDPEFQAYLKIVNNHEKSRSWKSGAANYRFGKLLFLASAKKITVHRLKQLLLKSLERKYHPDWIMFQLDENWKEIVGYG